jgi:hypothetical protein
MKNLNKFKVILKAIKKGSIPFHDYSNGIFQLDSIGLDRYYIDVNDSIESIKQDIEFYQKEVEKYREIIRKNSYKLVWNWMNI